MRIVNWPDVKALSYDNNKDLRANCPSEAEVNMRIAAILFVWCTHVLDRSAIDILNCRPRKCLHWNSFYFVSKLLWYGMVISCALLIARKGRNFARMALPVVEQQIIPSSRSLFIGRLGSKLVVHS